MATRPLSRVFLVEPAVRSGEPEPATAVLASLLSDTLAVHGVQVTRHALGAAPEGTARADLALWLPDEEGRLPLAGPRDVPARVHAALVVRPDVDRVRAEQFDALIAIHEVLVAPVERSTATSARAAEVLASPLPLVPLETREEAKRRRGLSSRPLVAIDLRHDFDAACDRVFFQLALAKEPAGWLLVVPPDADARARASELASRHQVDAFLASKPDAIAEALPAIDLVIGRLSWAELALAAAHRCALVWREEEGPLAAVLGALRQSRAVSSLVGVLQLAAVLDGELADPGGLKVKGTSIADQLTADAPAFVARVRDLKPCGNASRGAPWEVIGPQSTRRQRVVVDARDPEEPRANRAQQIEDQLRTLKDRLARSESAE